MSSTFALMLAGIVVMGFALYFLAKRSNAHKRLWVLLAITLLLTAIVITIFVPEFQIIPPHHLP